MKSGSNRVPCCGLHNWRRDQTLRCPSPGCLRSLLSRRAVPASPTVGERHLPKGVDEGLNQRGLDILRVALGRLPPGHQQFVTVDQLPDVRATRVTGPPACALIEVGGQATPQVACAGPTGAGLPDI